jgi:ABC-type transport system substrate-binding protein/transcriptional regulator with XRE-family HTH domain
MTLIPSLTFAELLRSHRAAAELTQEELAALAHLSVDAVSTLERGARRMPRKDTVALLADALDLSPEDRAVFVAAATSARRATSAALAASPPDSPVHHIADGEDVQTDDTTIVIKRAHSITTFLVDIWSARRANLAVVVASVLALLTIAGALLPLAIPTFPWVLSLATGTTVGLIGISALSRAVQRWMVSQWREARQPFAAVTSILLTLVVLLTTFFVSRPPLLALSQRGGYDFSYTYHRPTHTGGKITIGLADGLQTLAPNGLGQGAEPIVSPIWQGCIVQLPNQKLGLAGGGWQPDQCTEVPTVENTGESSDGKTTTFHIDPRAVWSDGVPITADDFLFAWQMGTDPNIIGDYPNPSVTITKLNAHTVQMRWDEPNGDYLRALGKFTPLPLHVYATGKFAGIYDPATRAYNSALAQQLKDTPEFNTTIPVDNGPFTIKSFTPDQQVIFVRNPNFFSNFFHSPAWDQVVLVSALKDFPKKANADAEPIPEMEADVIDMYRRGLIDLALPLVPRNLAQLAGIPRQEVTISPSPGITTLAFNQRDQAPNARANGGVSIFTDHTVRQAFIEAFDRCAAVRALLDNITCGDPNLFTDESDSTPSDQIFDPTFKLPAYNPSDAARLLDSAGYPVVDGIRRNKDRVTPLQIEIVPTPTTSAYSGVLKQLQQDYTHNLQVEVTILDYKSVYDRAVSGDFDLMLGESVNQADPILRLTIDDGPFDRPSIPSPQHPPVSSDFNWFGIVDEQVTQKETLAAQTLSEENQALILKSLQRYFSQQFYIEPVMVRVDITLSKPTLCNFKHWPQTGFDLWNIADWYVAPTCP